MSLFGARFLVDESKVTKHGNKIWKDAMDLSTSQNKSLPGIDSNFFNTLMDKTLVICLAVYQNSSIGFRPVIKQVTNIDGITTVQQTSNTPSLPFLCRIKTGKVSLKYLFYECNENCETSIKNHALKFRMFLSSCILTKFINYKKAYYVSIKIIIDYTN